MSQRIVLTRESLDELIEIRVQIALMEQQLSVLWARALEIEKEVPKVSFPVELMKAPKKTKTRKSTKKPSAMASAKAKRLFSTIKRAGPDGIAASTAARKTPGVGYVVAKRLISQMLAKKQIEFCRTTRANGKGSVRGYRAVPDASA